jgi:hypothetical protein
MIQAVIDLLIKYFPHLRGKFKRGDPFDENFYEEQLTKEGIVVNRIEGNKDYTLLHTHRDTENPKKLNAKSIQQLFFSTLVHEIEEFDDKPIAEEENEDDSDLNQSHLVIK